jgi:2-(1,2-epoxy-1,2-dihydrophenyl)acetyl-CoA isomerase
MAYQALAVEVAEGVARVTLNRPESFNAMNMEMCRELAALALDCQEREDVRAVLITGAGKAFCAGGDLASFQAQGDGLTRHVTEMATVLHVAISRLARMEAPVVAAVNGVAAGAGFSLVTACDLVLAAESARFTMAYTRAGLSPDGSGTYFLPRIVGLRRAMEMALTNPVLSASEAQAWGIVNRVLPDDACLDEAGRLARSLAAGPTRAYGAVKKLLATSFDDSLEGQLERETHYIAEMTRTADAREGIAAFLEKRRPTFSGR